MIASFSASIRTLKVLVLALAVSAAGVSTSWSWRLYQSLALARSAEPIFLTTERLVPGEAGVQRFDAGWSRAELQAVVDVLGADFAVLGLSASLTIAGTNQGAIPLTLYSISAPLELRSGLVLPSICGDRGVMLSDALLRHLPGGSKSFVIESEERVFVPGMPLWMRWLDRSGSEKFAVECEVGSLQQTGTLLVFSGQGVDLGLGALNARLDSSSVLQRGHFDRVIKVETVHDRVSKDVMGKFSWLLPVLAGSLIILCGLSLALGLVEGASRRGEARLRRVLGARSRDLLREALVRCAGVWLTALCLGFIGLSFVSEFFSRAELSLPMVLSISLALGVGALGLQALAAWFMRIHRIDTSLTRSDTGARAATAAINSQLLAWSCGVVLLSGFVVAALGVGLHVLRLQHTPLGYAPEGLLSIAVRLPTNAQRGDALRSKLARLHTSISVELAASQAWSLVCNPPWLYGTEPLHRATDRSIGTFVGVGPRGLEILSPESWRGEDFSEASWTDGDAVALQVRNEVERAVLGRNRVVLSEVEGVLLGAASPHLRSIVFVGLASISECADVYWIARENSIPFDVAEKLHQRLVLLFPDLAVSSVHLVTEFVSSERRATRELASVIVGICFTAAVGQLSLGAALAVLLAAAQRRSTAVRRALGASTNQLLLGQLRWLAPWVVIPFLIAIIMSIASESLLSTVLVDYAGISVFGAVLAVLAIVSTMLVLMLLAWSSLILRQNLNSELASE